MVSMGLNMQSLVSETSHVRKSPTSLILEQHNIVTFPVILSRRVLLAVTLAVLAVDLLRLVPLTLHPSDPISS
jgi:hypothetical protein